MIHQTEEHPTVAQLRQLSTLGALDDERLRALANEVTVFRGTAGDRLLTPGDTDPRMLYLLDGELELIARDGAVQRIRHTDSAAHNPIARLRPSQYLVRARSRVRFLRIDGEADDVLGPADNSTGIEHYEVVEETSISDIQFEYQLSAMIYEDLHADRLLLPSLPDVAVKVGQIVADENADSRKVASVVELDPVIATKLMKAANSPLYGGLSTIKSVPDAVVRLGMQTTHHLVITFALRELFRSNSRVLQERMTGLWSHACQVGAICHVLAMRDDNELDPELALLAGLTHDIGAVAVVAYAQEVDELNTDPAALDESINKLRGPIGSLMLKKWRLPAELSAAAQDAHHWQREHPGPPDYTDLVNTALLLSYIDSPHADQLPPLAEVAASHKFGFGELTDESGGDLLAAAAREISEARALLGL